MYLESPVQPRFCDTDAVGHINSTAVAQWFEIGRMHFLITCLPPKVPVILRHISIDYDRELTHLAPALVRTGIDKIGTRSITYRQEIWQQGACCASAIAVECIFDQTTRMSVPVPDDLRAIYSAHMYAD